MQMHPHTTNNYNCADLLMAKTILHYQIYHE